MVTSFIEKNVKTAFQTGEGSELRSNMKEKTETLITTVNSSQEKSEAKMTSEGTAERRSKVKHKSTSLSQSFSKKTETKSKTQTKVIPYIFTAILGTMFIAKTVFTYVENHYKNKRLGLMKEEIKMMKDDTFHLKKNEIEACTMSTLMLASNKNIILVYKLKLINIRAYKKYFWKQSV